MVVGISLKNLNKIKVLHVVAGSLNGGAARGAMNLHNSLRAHGVDSFVITNSIGDKDNYVRSVLEEKKIKLIKRKFLSLFSVAFKYVFKKDKSDTVSFGFTGWDITTCDEYLQADIINLHWINGLLNIKQIGKIRKPIVWTVRDLWPLTGGCHVFNNCYKFRTGCFQCEKLKNDYFDLSKIIYQRKLKNYPSNLNLVGLSSWISNLIKETALFKNVYVETIPNIINDEFVKFSKNEIRRKFLFGDKKIILIGAVNVEDKHKGFDLFIMAVSYLQQISDVKLCSFGSANNALLSSLGLEYVNFGYIDDNKYLSEIYSCADVFVAPYRAESFGKTAAEAMRCGTPVVAFGATGLLDIVDHKINGYLAEPYSPEDLAHGIEWVLNHPNYDELSKNARKKVEEKFDSKIVAEQYIELYEKILEGNKKND